MDLNKHIVTNDNYKPFHSNGFAQIANGDRVGSAGRATFEQRQLMDRNRQMISGYQRSTIGTVYGVSRSKPVINPTLNNLGASQQLPQQPNNINRQQFNSSPSRTYNPYA